MPPALPSLDKRSLSVGPEIRSVSRQLRTAKYLRIVEDMGDLDINFILFQLLLQVGD